ncbi:hypothetical protein [Yoonia sp. R78084]|uniref:hypothetical protein n=1 Tax=Yoonia sp. R78084 TaxID=3093869 RepID=UPI0037DC3CD0
MTSAWLHSLTKLSPIQIIFIHQGGFRGFSMGWRIILLLFGAFGIATWYEVKKRKAKLDAMSPEEREKFLADEEAQRAAEKKQHEENTRLRRIKEDDERSEGAKQQIEIARAEGRKYARVWVPQHHVDSVMRWAERQTYTALKVQERKHSTETQLSISGFI